MTKLDNLSDLELKESIFSSFSPDCLPVSMLDVDRLQPMDMDLNMSDACPRCGGHCMMVGDYVCWGHCYGCYNAKRLAAYRATGDVL